MKSLLLIVIVMVMVAAMASGATHYDVFVDDSASINAAQRQHWLQMTDKLTGRFVQGDAVTVYPVHNNTGSAAVLMDAASRPINDSMGADEQIAAHAEFVRMKKSFGEAMHTALTQPARATETDIFSAFDRIRPDPVGRHIVVLILSDMLQSSSHDVDMEKIHITETWGRRVIQDVAHRHHWGASTLAGVSVRCLLPPEGADARRPLNDRLSVRFFWETLCSSLGGKLDNFDTQL